MRDSNSILGFSVPAALIAILAVLPFMGREPAPPAPAAPTADTAPGTPRVISPTWPAFHVGCRLIAQVRGVPAIPLTPAASPLPPSAPPAQADSCNVEERMRVIALPLVALLGTEVAPVGETLFGWVGGLLRILSTT